jgi:hypothetical protein
MNTSKSKIRHIHEANMSFEKRTILKESSNDTFECSCPGLKDFIKSKLDSVPGKNNVSFAKGNWTMSDEDTILINFPGIMGVGSLQVKLNIS